MATNGFVVQYGSYIHQPGEIGPAFSRRALLNEAGIQYGVRELWSFDGFLIGDNPTDLTAKIQALELAYSLNFQPVRIFDSSGNITVHSLPGATPLGGVIVTSRPTFPSYQGAEYVNFRTYKIELECSYPVSLGTVALASWIERLDFQGTGGPKFVVRQPIIGLPQVQWTATNTPYHAVQTGEAVGLFDFPNVPGPLWPWAEHLEQRTGGLISPARTGVAYTRYRTAWRYVFESVVPLVGVPNLWTGG